MSPSRTGRWIALASCAGVLALTLTPPASGAMPGSITCMWCDPHALQDAVVNVLLFVPLGIGLALSGVSTRIAVALIVALTAGVEAAQLGLVAGRDPSLRDFLANAAGGGAGLLLGAQWNAIAFPRRRIAWRFAGYARIAWVVLNIVLGWLLIPDVPERPESVIAGTHVGGFADFAGRIENWTLGLGRDSSLVAPNRDSVLVVAALLVQPGPVRREVTPVLTVVDGQGSMPVLLALEESDVVVGIRLRAASARLRAPWMRFTDVIKPWYRSPASSETLQLRMMRTAPHGVLDVATRLGANVHDRVAVRTSQGWSLFSPSTHHLTSGLDLASALWCLAWMLPIGYWSAASGRVRARMAWSLAVTAGIGGLLVGPLFLSLSMPAPADVAAAALGLVGGGVAWRLASHTTKRPSTT